MTGIKDFNFPKFKEVAASMRVLGYDVRCPAEHDEEIYGVGRFNGDGDIASIPWFDFKKSLDWDFDQVSECDVIVMLPGWEKSTGARAEHAVAVAYGKEIRYQ
jgi:hypothetical protein